MPSAKLSGDARLEIETTLRHTRDETEQIIAPYRLILFSVGTDHLRVRRDLLRKSAPPPAAHPWWRRSLAGAPLPGAQRSARQAPAGDRCHQSPRGAAQSEERTRPQLDRHPSPPGAILAPCLPPSCPGMPASRFETTLRHTRDETEQNDRSLPTDSLLLRHGSSTCAARPAEKVRTATGGAPLVAPVPGRRPTSRCATLCTPSTGRGPVPPKSLGARRRARNAPDPSLIDTLLRQELSSRHAFRQAVRGCPRRDRNHAAAHARRDGADHRSLPTDSLLRRHGSSTCAARPAEKVRTATGGAPLVAPVPGRRPTSRCATLCSHSTGRGPVPPESSGRGAERGTHPTPA